MAVMLYMDVHVPQPITDQLRRRGGPDVSFLRQTNLSDHGKAIVGGAKTGPQSKRVQFFRVPRKFGVVQS
jgi:hypothetical protein